MPTAASYQIHMCDPFGVRIDTLARWEKLSYQSTANEVGELTLVLPGDYDQRMLRKDGRIEVERLGRLEHDQSWLIRYISRRIAEDGHRTIVLRCFSGLYLVCYDDKGRRVAYDPDTPQASKTDYPDNMIKALIRENVGSSATDTARSLAAYLTVQADQSAVLPTLSKEFSYMPLLQACQEVAAAAATNGVWLGFDTPYDRSTRTYEFRTYVGQRGVDRRAGSGSPVVFSFERGNVVSEELTDDYTDEVSFVYAGATTGDTLFIATDFDQARLDSSPFGRREAFRRVSSVTYDTAVSDEAHIGVWEGRPRRVYLARTRDMPHTAYGEHWSYGDYVTVETSGLQLDCRIDGVRVTVNNQEQIDEQIDVTLGYTGAL